MAEYTENLNLMDANTDLVEKLKAHSLSSRETYEASIKAFVSYIRFYQEHQAKFIFRLKELDIPSLARTFGLLRLPSMPELRNTFTPAQLEGFEATSHDPDGIGYTDVRREKQRGAALERKHLEKESVSAVKAERTKKRQSNVAWSEQKAKKQARQERKEKREKKREYLHKLKRQPAVTEEIENESEEDDMAHDYRELKKERKMKKNN